MGASEKRTTPAFGSVCRMLFLEPANPFDVKARRQFRQEAIVLGTFILTALGLALYFNLKAIAR